MEQRKKMFLLALLQIILLRTNHMMCMLLLAHLHARNTRNMRRRRGIRYSLIRKIPDITAYMDKLTELTDVQCINNLRMDRNCFLRLCYVLCHGAGLRDEKYVSVREQVTLFLKVLAHHDKNRIMGFHWQRSGHTISRYFNKTLRALLLLEKHIFSTPKPIADENNNCHEPWKCFKGCLGALDGTFVDVWALRRDQPRYRTRKGRISVNVLGVCDINMQFVYVLPGWEGSTADSRILKDAVNRPTGLKVPQGNYYLVDGGYANCEGYLAPYRGKRYHLKEWGNGNVVPRDYQEYFKRWIRY